MPRTRSPSEPGGHGKYLVFRIGDEDFGFDVLDVQEIIGLRKVTRLPNMPPFVRGVINLRGKIVPVMDLRRKFGLPDADDSPKTCIIVAQLTVDGAVDTVSAVVDLVTEVIDIPTDAIEDAPSLGDPTQADFMRGIAKLDGRVIVLLDATRCLAGGALAALGAAAQLAARVARDGSDERDDAPAAALAPHSPPAAPPRPERG
jgi:purine-binding chemotaxis protein CheW